MQAQSLEKIAACSLKRSTRSATMALPSATSSKRIRIKVVTVLDSVCDNAAFLTWFAAVPGLFMALQRLSGPAAKRAALVVASATDPHLRRRMNVPWGIVLVLLGGPDLKHPHAMTRKLNLAEPGHFILTVAGFGSAATEMAPSVTALVV
jgi:hypothetical protein